MRPDVAVTFGAFSRQHVVIPSPLPAVVELPFPLMRHLFHQTDEHVQMVNRHLSGTVRAAVWARSYSGTTVTLYLRVGYSCIQKESLHPPHAPIHLTAQPMLCEGIYLLLSKHG